METRFSIWHRLRRGAHGSANGFTLVEVIIVLVIVAILMAIVVPAMTGPKKAAVTKELVAAAASYDSAVLQYRSDNGNYAPKLGSADWPTSQAINGPLNKLTRKPYITGGPPSVMVRSHHTSSSEVPKLTTTHVRSQAGDLVYRASGNSPSYAIDVYYSGRKVCYLGTTTESGVSRCTD